MGQDGIPMSIAIVVGAAILGASFLVGMVFLGLLPALVQ